MNIAIIGSGYVGSTLGRRLADAGNQIRYGSRQPDSDKVAALVGHPSRRITASSIEAAVTAAEVVIYAAPYDQAANILQPLPDFHGRVLVDCTNPLNATFDGLQLGHTDSAAEQIARLVPTARVVKSFNTSSVATMENPRYGDLVATQFYCGDDETAKQTVAALILQLGMEPVDAGPLCHARYLEATAMLHIHLAIRGGWGGHCALKMLKR